MKPLSCHAIAAASEGETPCSAATDWTSPAERRAGVGSGSAAGTTCVAGAGSDARAGVAPEQIAGVNGLDVNGFLVEGTTIKLPPASTPAPQEAAPASEAIVPEAAPEPAPGRVTSSDIHRVAGEQGVDGSLAAAIGWQESGFNNAMVSSANARGVMQVMPGTWDYVENVLGAGDLDPSSATDNVRAGVIYLKQLLNQTGGDETAAAAA
ncbi:MAG TPA: transglycosylase SLT domain-containing protein, partial [Solirubrobacteraceae bacterium]|nr:transglycosylase SLT domain-containing protein [Solirubrobacteraceae bacterium]